MKPFSFADRISPPALPIGVALLAGVVLGPLIALAIALQMWKLFVLLLLIAGVPALIRWPVTMAFGMYALVIPFDAVSAVSDAGGATVSKLLGVIAAGVLIGVGLIERRLVYPPATALWFGLFVFWGLLSVGWSVNLDMSMARIPTSVSILLLYVVAASFRVSAKELRSVMLLTILGGLLAASVLVILGEDVMTKPDGRARLTLDEKKANINFFAAGLLAPLLFTIGRFFDKGRFVVKALALAAMAVIVSCIYMLASRGAALAAVCGLGLLIARSRRVWLGLIVVAACLVLVSFAPEVFVARVSEVLEGSDTTGSGRTRIWRVAFKALGEYWVFGSGLSTFMAVYNMYVPVPTSKGMVASHSTFIGTWVELGIVGLMLLVLTLTMHLYTSLRVRRPSIDLVTIEAGCLALMVAATLGDFLSLKTFWLPWTLLIWSLRLHTEDQRRVEARSEDGFQRVAEGVSQQNRLVPQTSLRESE